MITNSMTITNASLPLRPVFESTNILAAVIPALRKLTVEVADDDVSGKSSVLNLWMEVANRS